MAHTPGPWEMTWDSDLESDVRVCRIDDGKCICCVALMGDYDHDQEGWAPETLIEWKDNARAIAAVPEMLEFIEECAKPPWPDSDLGGLLDWVRCRASAILLKAKAARQQGGEEE